MCAFRHAYRQTPGYNLSVRDMSACPFWEWACWVCVFVGAGLFPCMWGGRSSFGRRGRFAFGKWGHFALQAQHVSCCSNECQRVLTVGKGATGSVLELFERRIGLEGLREVLGALSMDLVVVQTTNGSREEASGGADSE